MSISTRGRGCHYATILLLDDSTARWCIASLVRNLILARVWLICQRVVAISPCLCSCALRLLGVLLCVGNSADA